MAARTETVLTVDRPGPPPAPLAFLAALRELFARQAAAVLSEAGPRAVRTGLDLDLGEWEREMVARLRPLYLRYFQAGLAAGSRQMAAVPSFPAPQKKRYLTAVRKAVSARFDLYEPRVLDAVDAAVLRFCRETNATAAGELNATLAELRRQLKQGLSQGDAREALVARVRTVFTDPSRALRIAVTESARAVNGGQVLAWKGSGRVGRKRWLASSDACGACLDLDGEEVDLDAPFVTLPGGGPYAIVYHPPLHPHCHCVCNPVVTRPAVAVPARPAQAPPGAAPAGRPAVALGPGRPAGPKAAQPWDRDRNRAAAAGLFPRLRADGEAKAAAKEVTAELAAAKAETARLEGERKARLEKLDRLVFRGKEAATPEERAALRAETDAALAETKTAADRLRALYASAQKGYRDVLAGRLTAPDPVPVRPAFAAVNALAGTRAEQSVNEATDFLGKVLGRTAADGPAVSIGFRRVALTDPQRAYHEAGTVYLLPHSPVHEVLHEVGHALEYLYPKAAEAARAFWERRCGAGTATPLAQKFGPAYDPREVGYDDDFGKVYGKDSVESYYAGKRYPTGETEVLSMGLQALVERPADLAKDPEWWALVVGVLRGDYR